MQFPRALYSAELYSCNWLVAYSGGKDSTAVLDLAYRYAAGRGIRLVVVHNEELLKAPPLFNWVYEVLDGLVRAGVEVYVTVPREDFLSVIFERRYSPPGPAFMRCTACGFEADRDVVAVLNIERRAQVGDLWPLRLPPR